MSSILKQPIVSNIGILALVILSLASMIMMLISLERLKEVESRAFHSPFPRTVGYVVTPTEVLYDFIVEDEKAIQTCRMRIRRDDTPSTTCTQVDK